MTEVVFTAGEPRPATSQSATQRRKTKGKKLSKGKKFDELYRYPTREELEGTSRKCAVAKKLDEVRAAEKLTLQRYNQLKFEVLTDANPNINSEFEAGSTTCLPKNSPKSPSHEPNVKNAFQDDLMIMRPLTAAGSMATTLKSLDASACTLYKENDQPKIKYTPEIIMKMECMALEQVKQEAIDAHSAALQEREDLRDSLHDLDDELLTITNNLKVAQDKTTSLTAIMRTAEDIFEDMRLKNEVVQVEKTIKEKDLILEKAPEEQHSHQSMSVTTHTLPVKQLSEVEQESKKTLYHATMPIEQFEPPGRRLKRKPSPLSMHSLRAPHTGYRNMADQQNLKSYLAFEQKKAKLELLSKLNLYVDILNTMREASYRRPEMKLVMEKINEFIPKLVNYDIIPDHDTETVNNVYTTQLEHEMFKTELESKTVQSIAETLIENETVQESIITQQKSDAVKNMASAQSDIEEAHDTCKVVEDTDSESNVVCDSIAAQEDDETLQDVVTVYLKSKSNSFIAYTKPESKVFYDSVTGHDISRSNETVQGTDSESENTVQLDSMVSQDIPTTGPEIDNKIATNLEGETEYEPVMDDKTSESVIENITEKNEKSITAKLESGRVLETEIESVQDIAEQTIEIQVRGTVVARSKSETVQNTAMAGPIQNTAMTVKGKHYVEDTEIKAVVAKSMIKAVEDNSESETVLKTVVGDKKAEAFQDNDKFIPEKQLAEDTITAKPVQNTVIAEEELVQDTHTVILMRESVQDTVSKPKSDTVQKIVTTKPEVEAVLDTVSEAKCETVQDNVTAEPQVEAMQDTVTESRSETDQNIVTTKPNVEVVQDTISETKSKTDQNIVTAKPEFEAVQDTVTKSKSETDQNIVTAKPEVEAAQYTVTEPNSVQDIVSTKPEVETLPHTIIALPINELAEDDMPAVLENDSLKSTVSADIKSEAFTKAELESELVKVNNMDELEAESVEDAKPVSASIENALTAEQKKKLSIVTAVSKNQAFEKTVSSELEIQNDVQDTFTAKPEIQDDSQNTATTEPQIENFQKTIAAKLETDAVPDTVTAEPKIEAVQDTATKNADVKNTVTENEEVQNTVTEVEVIYDTITAQDTVTAEPKLKDVHHTVTAEVENEAVQDIVTAEPEINVVQETVRDELEMKGVHDTVTAKLKSELAEPEGETVQDIITAEPDIEVVQETVCDELETKDVHDAVTAKLAEPESEAVRDIITTELDIEVVQGTVSNELETKDVLDAVTAKLAEPESEAVQDIVIDEPDIEVVQVVQVVQDTVRDKPESEAIKGIVTAKSETEAVQNLEHYLVQDTVTCNAENDTVPDTVMFTSQSEVLHDTVTVDNDIQGTIFTDSAVAVTNEVQIKIKAVKSHGKSVQSSVTRDQESEGVHNIATHTVKDSVTSELKAKATDTTGVNTVPVKVKKAPAFLKFSEVLKICHTTTGLNEVSSFLLPKKSVSKSWPAMSCFKHYSSSKNNYSGEPVPVALLEKAHSEKRADFENTPTLSLRRMSI